MLTCLVGAQVFILDAPFLIQLFVTMSNETVGVMVDGLGPCNAPEKPRWKAAPSCTQLQPTQTLGGMNEQKEDPPSSLSFLFFHSFYVCVGVAFFLFRCLSFR